MISASFSLSLPRLGWKSTSIPRSLKIWTAAADRASEMSTRGAMGVSRFRCRHRPRKRTIQYADASRRASAAVRAPVVVGRAGRPPPDAQAGRRVAIMGEIVAGAFLLDHGGEAFGETRLRVGRKLGHRRIDDLEADRGVGGRRRI